MNPLWLKPYCYLKKKFPGLSKTASFSDPQMPKILCVRASKCHHVSMTFPEQDNVLQPSYPIFALTGGGTVLEATLLICIVHLPWSHSGVQEVSFQRLIVQTRSPTRAVKKTNLQWDWLLYRGFICVQQEEKKVSHDKSSDETKWEGKYRK